MITVIKQPLKYTPSNNPIIFQVESDQSALKFFKVEVLEHSTDAVISNLNIHIQPNYQNGSFIDLSKILSSAVKWDVDNDIAILSHYLEDAVLKYKVRFTEMGISAGAVVALGSPLTVSNLYVWNADMNRFKFQSFDLDAYLVKASAKNKFLTDKPNFAEVTESSSEQLCALIDDVFDTPIYFQVKAFNTAGVLVGLYHEEVTVDVAGVYRFQVSPKSLTLTMDVNFTNVEQYQVRLVYSPEDVILGTGGQRLSETRTYVYKQVSCGVEPTNLLWINSLGGVDSYQFQNVQETINYTKNNIKKNIYRFKGGDYGQVYNGILYGGEETIDVEQQGTYEVNSRFITDEESYWFSELFKSEQVFVELKNQFLVPVSVTNTNYQIQRQKYNKSGLNFIRINYTMSGDVIPPDAELLYYNKEQRQTLTKEGCGVGYVGSEHEYVVAAGQYSSPISQSAADQLAIDDINTLGQAYVNSIGTCIGGVGNEYQSDYFLPVCPSGTTAEAYLYEVPADTFFADTLANANQLALDDIDANGQTEANANGTCTLDVEGITLTPVDRIVADLANDDYYVKVHADQGVTANIDINLTAYDGTYTTPLSTITMFSGETDSYEIYVGSYPIGTPVIIQIQSVTPNPDGAGTNYYF